MRLQRISAIRLKGGGLLNNSNGADDPNVMKVVPNRKVKREQARKDKKLATKAKLAAAQRDWRK